MQTEPESSPAHWRRLDLVDATLSRPREGRGVVPTRFPDPLADFYWFSEPRQENYFCDRLREHSDDYSGWGVVGESMPL